MIRIFNPFSILNCFKMKRLRDFWFASGTPGYLMRLLAKSDEHINELVGRYYDATQFVDYKANSVGMSSAARSVSNSTGSAIPA